MVKIFLEREKRLFKGSFDIIKRLISDFDSEKDRMLVKDLLLTLSREAVHKNLSIIVEGSASIMLEMRSFYSALAKEESIDFFEINLEAPLEVLQERLQERVAGGRSWTVTKPEQLSQRYSLYIDRKDSAVSVYDTTIRSSEEIYSLVMKDVLKK